MPASNLPTPALRGVELRTVHRLEILAGPLEALGHQVGAARLPLPLGVFGRQLPRQAAVRGGTGPWGSTPCKLPPGRYAMVK